MANNYNKRLPFTIDLIDEHWRNLNRWPLSTARTMKGTEPNAG